MRISAMVVCLSLALSSLAAAQESSSDEQTLANLLRQRPIAIEEGVTGQLSPEILAALIECLQARQQPQVRAAPTADISPDLVALVNYIVDQRSVMAVPEIINEHQYVLPATIRPQRETIHINRGNEPRVHVELARRRYFACFERFAANFMNMWRLEAACISRCPVSNCNCGH